MLRLFRSRAILAVLSAPLLAATAIGGAYALFTNTVSVDSNTFNSDILDPPTDLAVRPGTGEGTIDLTWTPTVDPYASGRRLYRSLSPGGPYSQFAEVTPLAVSSYQDAGRASGMTYYYIARSFFNNWTSEDSNEAAGAAPGLLRLQQDDVTLSYATSPSGNIDTNNGTVDYFAASVVASASNETDWTLVMVQRDKPTSDAPAAVNVWWQNGGACSSGPVAGQTFASGIVTVPAKVDKRGVTLTVPKVAGAVSHTFLAGDILCLSVSADGSGGAYDLHYYANIDATSGTPGVSRLVGPYTTVGSLNLQSNGTTISTDTSPTGTVSIKNAQTNYFQGSAVAATNASDWSLILVLKDRPSVDAPATINVWWQNGGACSGGAVPGQTFAGGSVTVPTAGPDKKGVTITIPKTAGVVTREFSAGDLLCLSISADGSGGANDITFHANVASTSGVGGISRLEGSYSH